jgi:hypothetical protein
MQSNLNDAVEVIKHCLTVDNERAIGRDPEDFRVQALSALAVSLLRRLLRIELTHVGMGFFLSKSMARKR